MSTSKLSTVGKVGAALFIVYGAGRLIRMIAANSTSLLSVLYDAGIIAVGIGLLASVMMISVVGSAVTALCEFIWAFQNVKSGFEWGFDKYTVLYTLLELLPCIAFILLCIMLLPHALKKPGGQQGSLSNLWFLPGVIAVIGFVIQFSVSISWYLSSEGIFFGLIYLVLLAAFFLAGNGLSKLSPAPAQYGPGRQAPPYGQMPGYGNQPYGNQPQAPGYGNPPYGNQPQAPGYGSAPYGNAPQAPGYGAPQGTPVTPIQPVAPVSPVSSDTMTGLSSENVEAMMKYKQLLDAGIISQAEFDELKKKLLG